MEFQKICIACSFTCFANLGASKKVLKNNFQNKILINLKGLNSSLSISIIAVELPYVKKFNKKIDRKFEPILRSYKPELTRVQFAIWTL